jgi:hypothetical protein
MEAEIAENFGAVISGISFGDIYLLDFAVFYYLYILSIGRCDDG